MSLTIPTPLKSRKGNFRRLNLCVALGFASVAGQAGAAQLEEVIVTAQKKSQSLQEVPVAVSVVSGDTIQNEAIVDLYDLAAKIPTVKLSASVVGELINIRGFGSGNNASIEQAVATFVDGAYRGRAASSNFAFLDMAQLEVLKGPQTVYFGANATAGAFNITTKKANPGDPTSANVSAYYDPEYGDYILEGGVSTSLSDTLAGRVALKFNGGDGYTENRIQNRDESEVEDYAARVSLAWEPTDSYRMDVRFDVGETDRDDLEGEIQSCVTPKFGFGPAGLCEAYVNAGPLFAGQTGAIIEDKLDWKVDGGGAVAHYKADFMEFVLTNVWELDSGKLTAVTTYYDHESDRLASPAPYPLPNNLGEFGAFFPAQTMEEFQQITQEIRFETSLNDMIDLTVGGYYLDSELNFDQYQALLFVPGANGLGMYFDIDVEEKTYSLFSALDINITDAVTLNLGVRYTDVEKKATGINTAGVYSTGLGDLGGVYTPFPNAVTTAPGGFAPGLSIADFLSLNVNGFARPTYEDSAVQPSIGITWDVGADTMVYAKYNEGFKSGGFGFHGPLVMFDAEEVKAYEIGLKSSLLDGAMNLSLAAFFNKYQNLQEAGNRTNDVGGVETFIGNVGSVEAEGVELGINWQATDDLRVDLDVAYLDSTSTSFTNATCDEITTQIVNGGDGRIRCDLSGKTRPFAPEWSGSLSATYTIPVGESEITIQPSMDFSSSYNTLSTLDPVGFQESYEKLNLRLAYGPNDGSWTVALVGKNLTDEYTSDFRNISPTGPGAGVVWPNAPRTVGIQFNWNYE